MQVNVKDVLAGIIKNVQPPAQVIFFNVTAGGVAHSWYYVNVASVSPATNVLSK